MIQLRMVNLFKLRLVIATFPFSPPITLYDMNRDKLQLIHARTIPCDKWQWCLSSLSSPKIAPLRRIKKSHFKNFYHIRKKEREKLGKARRVSPICDILTLFQLRLSRLHDLNFLLRSPKQPLPIFFLFRNSEKEAFLDVSAMMMGYLYVYLCVKTQKMWRWKKKGWPNFYRRICDFFWFLKILQILKFWHNFRKILECPKQDGHPI
jgi:hypothetical protein